MPRLLDLRPGRLMQGAWAPHFMVAGSTVSVPSGANIDALFDMTRASGTNLDCYFDDVEVSFYRQ